jgi:3'(2'), 5'-bisphosphate nucleotidase
VPPLADAVPDLNRRLLEELTASLVRASAAILAVTPATLATRLKPDQSPVTAADEASEATILRDLSRLLPGVPVMSEEAAGGGRTAVGRDFLLVDPLDGTREFIGGRPEYTVNLAIVRDRTPIVGLIAAPALGVVWRGVVGRGAERLRVSDGAAVAPAAIRTRRAPDRLVAALSRSHLDAATASLAERLPIAERMAYGSALKFCRIAEGSADVYPRLSPTSEWDVAAGHALITAAGGIVTTPAGEALVYGNVDQDLLIPGFLAWGDPATARRYRG